MADLGGWSYDKYEGIGEGGTCAIPMCNKPAETRGLCNSCFQAWHRFGHEGLERRAHRLQVGVGPFFRVPVRNRDAIKKMLFAALDEWRECDSEDDKLYKKLEKRVEHIAKALATCDFRRKKRAEAARRKKKFVAAHGIKAWRRMVADTQLRYRQRKKQRAEKNGASDCKESDPLTVVG